MFLCMLLLLILRLKNVYSIRSSRLKFAIMSPVPVTILFILRGFTLLYFLMADNAEKFKKNRVRDLLFPERKVVGRW